MCLFYHKTNQSAMFAKSAVCAIIIAKRAIAQLVARMVRDHEAAGSSPASPTT